MLTTNSTDEEIINYCTERFNLIRETIVVERDDDWGFYITGRSVGSIEYLTVTSSTVR